MSCLHGCLQEAIVLAAAGSSITPATEPLAGGRHAAQLSLTQLGLCQMVARTQAFEEPEDHLHPMLLRQHQRRLPLRRPQPAACADSLASCAGGLSAAVEAALATVDERGAGGEARRRVRGVLQQPKPTSVPSAATIKWCGSMHGKFQSWLIAWPAGTQDLVCWLLLGDLICARICVPDPVQFALHISQLAVARWWHELLGRSIASMQLEMEALHRIAFRVAHMAKANWEVNAGTWVGVEGSAQCTLLVPASLLVPLVSLGPFPAWPSLSRPNNMHAFEPAAAAHRRAPAGPDRQRPGGRAAAVLRLTRQAWSY